MARKKEDVVEKVLEVAVEAPKGKSELEHLQELYAELRALGVNSIGDLEVKIARLQK